MRPTKKSAVKSTATVSTTTPTIALAIVQSWLVLGTLAVLCVPSLRGTSVWFGWLPFWFIAMPAAEWALLRWRRVAEHWQEAVNHLRQRTQLRRRPTTSRRVRHPAPRTSRVRAHSVLTALLLR